MIFNNPNGDLTPEELASVVSGLQYIEDASMAQGLTNGGTAWAGGSNAAMTVAQTLAGVAESSASTVMTSGGPGRLGGGINIPSVAAKVADYYSITGGYSYDVKVEDVYCVSCKLSCGDGSGKKEVRKRTFKCLPSSIGVDVNIVNRAYGTGNEDIWGGTTNPEPVQMSTTRIAQCIKKAKAGP